MRIKIVILILLLQPVIMKSQNATATIGNITSCAGESVLVPFDVTDFNDVGAMTIYIGYDTNAAEFLSIQNINPDIPGSLSFNAMNGQVSIAYSYVTPFYITGEKLFDLSFSFLGDSTLLPFNPGTEIANSNLEIIPLDTYTGSISNSIQLINQPDSVQSYPDNDVTFKVTSLGSPNYQWQENTGSGWTDLQNNDVYSGVNTDSLTIYDVPLSFNGYIYRCELTADECTVISDVALLEVALAFPAATLGYISSCPENTILEPVLVGDFFDVIEFTFNISFDTTSLDFLQIENIHPGLIPGNLTVSPLLNPPGLVIHWNHTTPVSIISDKLFDLKFDYDSQSHVFAFEDGTVVLNSFSNPINITLNNGAITQYALPLITSQPQNDTVIELQVASFSVEASGTDNYLWLVSTDDGNSWTDLTNTPPYTNVNTPVLTISPAVYSMNEYQYACLLGNEFCTVFSTAALLVVDTLTYINIHEGKFTVQVYPVPFKDKIHLSLPDGSPYSQISIFNTDGIRLFSANIRQQLNQAEVELDLSSLSNGLFLLKLTGTLNGKTVTEQKKIIKTN
jgi:hypothetical protein